MKRTLKLFFLTIIGSLLVWITFDYIRGLFQPFRFEDFKSREEVQKYFDLHYPVGSNVEKLIKEVEASGGECGEAIHDRDWPKEDFKYDKWYGCTYYTGLFLSRDPMVGYNITIYTNKDNKIIEAYVARHTGYL